MLNRNKTRLLFLGGYLGAGKTTLALNLARELKKKYGKLTSLIMNDQGCVLVDTEYSRGSGFDTRDITGGCFCTNFDKFVSDARAISISSRPDVIIAEPIGTSTNVMSSVIAPLRLFYPDEFSVVPYTVVVDCSRALDVLSDEGKPVADAVNAIPVHQIKDAEKIILTKIDLVNNEKIIEIKKKIESVLPGVEIIETSSSELENIDAIVSFVLSDAVSTRIPIGEQNEEFAIEKAKLGWYSCACDIVPSESVDMYSLETELMKGVMNEYDENFVVHVKVLVESPESAAKMSLVGNTIHVDGVYGSRYVRMPGKLILNARIVSPPRILGDVMRRLVSNISSKYRVAMVRTEEKCFSPRPESPAYFFSE